MPDYFKHIDDDYVPYDEEEERFLRRQTEAEGNIVDDEPLIDGVRHLFGGARNLQT